MMTAIGAGIVGFAGGILLGEVAAGYGFKNIGRNGWWSSYWFIE